MSIADDLRDAANLAALHGTREQSARLRAHADTIERVWAEMRTCGSSMVGEFRVSEWADALKGDAT